MSGVRLRLPATSANLGPGFDTLALALKLHLEIEAQSAPAFGMEATGRNANLCGALRNNLLLDTYSTVLAAQNRPAVPLHIRMNNQIPLGMGCGSSAAVRLAGVALAAHFGQLEWGRECILAEACRLEGHPDNAAACWLGGFVASAFDDDRVQAVSFAPPAEWRALIVMPRDPLATAESRAVLPETYTRRDVVANLQRVSLLTAAFASGRPELLANAMRDWLHQPYRSAVCKLLPPLLDFAGQHGVTGVALSGAGPAVLMLTDSPAAARQASEEVVTALQHQPGIEILTCELEREPALFQPVS